MPETTPVTLADRILQGEIRAAARLMRNVDDDMPHAVAELKQLYPHTGNAFIIGVTGPPGAGKSTLTDKLIESYRRRNMTVGVVAIDPTSPFSGGAILGDRIRMNRHATDPGVFIRSLGTRGHLGGLSNSANDIVHILDAMGMQVIIVETVGVGQDEVEIARTAHTTLVVMVPGLGDDIQAIKAGILEIGDIFVVNKADRPDADRTARELSNMVDMKQRGADEWIPPVVMTVAQKSNGLADLVDKIDQHRAYLLDDERLASHDEEQSRQRFTDLLKERLFRQVLGRIEKENQLQSIVKAIAARERDPYSAVEEILRTHLR